MKHGSPLSLVGPWTFNNMKDRENNQPQGVQLPPTWCSGICRNAMNEICIEHCAIKRDCSAFEPKPNLKLGDMPGFPLNESAGMTREEKFTSVTIYLAKVVDHLQGIEYEPHHLIFPRASQAVIINKAIAEVAAGLQNSQNDTVGVDANEEIKETE